MGTSERARPQWHRVYPACLDCGGTERRHQARGLCVTCMGRCTYAGSSYDGNAAPSMGRGGAHGSLAEQNDIAARAVARARERGWKPRHELGEEARMRGWGGRWCACRDCGSDKVAHARDGYCALCQAERDGRAPTALEASIAAGGEPPLARASLAARRAYEDALAAMESLDLALDAIAAPAQPAQLRRAI